MSPSSHSARNQGLRPSAEPLRKFCANCGSCATSQHAMLSIPNAKPTASARSYTQSPNPTRIHSAASSRRRAAPRGRGHPSGRPEIRAPYAPRSGESGEGRDEGVGQTCIVHKKRENRGGKRHTFPCAPASRFSASRIDTMEAVDPGPWMEKILPTFTEAHRRRRARCASCGSVENPRMCSYKGVLSKKAASGTSTRANCGIRA